MEFFEVRESGKENPGKQQYNKANSNKQTI